MVNKVPTNFSPGSLVKARGRNWVVLAEDESNVVRLRPVDGSDNESIGIYLPIEPNSITSSEYEWPDSNQVGNFQGGLLLRDALRLTLRSGAGPFRSLGRISVVPRPYQYVPLVMALRQDPVRLLIADDVGVGKTIEAAMIARELLDRGLANRLGVICAPHLCDQWAQELKDKFNIDTAVIQPARISRLEKGLPRKDISIYKYYRHLVVSIDYIKSQRNKGAFLDNCPDLIIVDEAHTVARPRGNKGGNQHQRYQFLKELSKEPNRHLILATATPHSGVEESFRSVLGLLDEAFDVSEQERLPRRQIVPHFIQRKRSDLKNWLDSETPFPERESSERSYQLSSEYLNLFEDVSEYCRESISTSQDGKHQRQRVRYWAAMAILRCVLSSPAAAAKLLEKRYEKRKSEADDELIESDEAFANQILDSSDDDEPPDYIPSAALDKDSVSLSDGEIRKLNGFLKSARELSGPKHDVKLSNTADVVSELLSDNYSPIVFCRFVATAEYVAEQLQSILAKTHKNVRVVSVTGGDGNNEQRKAKIEELGKEDVRVLVATDCLSEGINLQESFNAVIHYDLPWNPNRLEQREGRVDRFGQEKDKVRTVLVFGANHPMDIPVLNVLIRKARTIREQLGISVPVPVESDQVIQVLLESILFKGRGQQLRLAMDVPEATEFHSQWDSAAKQQGQARAYYTQNQIDPNDVAIELREMEPVLGTNDELKEFVENALQRFNGSIKPIDNKNNVFVLEAGDLQSLVTERLTETKLPLRISFDGVPREGVIRLHRNHPAVSVIAEAVLSRSLKGESDNFARCAAIYTDGVQVRTAILVLRIRYSLTEKSSKQFAEEIVVAAFNREKGELHWIEPVDTYGIDLLKKSRSVTNMPDTEKTTHVDWALGMLKDGWYEKITERRSGKLDESHTRLRNLVKNKKLQVRPHTPPDILGCYVLVPSGKG